MALHPQVGVVSSPDDVCGTLAVLSTPFACHAPSLSLDSSHDITWWLPDCPSTVREPGYFSLKPQSKPGCPVFYALNNWGEGDAGEAWLRPVHRLLGP